MKPKNYDRLTNLGEILSDILLVMGSVLISNYISKNTIEGGISIIGLFFVIASTLTKIQNRKLMKTKLMKSYLQ